MARGLADSRQHRAGFASRSRPELAMTSVRLGVVGVGHVGTTHARELAAGRVAGASLAGIADPSARARASFPDVPSFASAAELIGSGAIDALVIATPHYSHTPLAIDAL